MFHQTETMKSHKSRAGIPSNLNPASKEMISDSVELGETEVCFLHIQLIGTNVWLPKTHNVPPEVDFESSSILQIRSLETVSACIVCRFLHITMFLLTCVMDVRRFSRLLHALVHFVIDRARLFTDHRISGRPIRAKKKHVRTIWEHTCDNSPTDFIFSSLKWWSSMHGVHSL